MPVARRAVLIGAIVLGIFFRCYHLDTKVYWEDEIFGTVHALGYTEAQIVREAPHMHRAADLQRFFHLPPGGESGGLGNTIASLAAEDPQHPPLYYLLSHLWMERFGSSAAAVRALPAIFGVLALPCAYWLALELFGAELPALTFAALLAASPFFVLYAQEAREYSLWALTILLSGVTLLRALRVRSVAAWGGFAIVSLAGVFVDPLSALVLLGQALFVAVVEGRRRGASLVAFALCAAFTALGFFPWARIMLHSGGLERGMAGMLGAKLSAAAIAVTFARNLRDVFFDFGAFRIGPLGSTFANFALVVIGVLLAAFALVRLIRLAPPKAAAFVTLSLCLPPLLLVARDLAGSGRLVYQARYFTPLYLGLELAVAFALTAASPARVRRANAGATALLLAGGFASCAISSQAGTWWNKDYEQSRDVAQAVNRSPDAIVISDGGTSRILGLGYYLDPRVALSLDPSCEQCAIANPHRSDLLAGGPYGNAFLLGPSQALARAAARIDSREHVTIIGVGIYTGSSTALNMFRQM